MKIVLISLAIILLSACSSTALNSQYYLLDTPENTVSTSNSEKITGDIVLMRLALADYLQQPNLVMLEKNHQVYYATEHVWAENLKHSLKRVLINDFDVLSANTLLAADAPGTADIPYQLHVDIEHFVATVGSEAILSGKFWLLDKGQQVAVKNFYFKGNLSADGFGHAVKTQRNLVRSLAQLIVDTSSTSFADNGNGAINLRGL